MRVYRELKRASAPLATLARIRERAARQAARDRLARQRVDAAREAYETSQPAPAKDSFMLGRTIGNDLEPRHTKGQSHDNVRFVLDNEPELPDCEKFWIVDPDEEARIVDLLQSRGQSFHTIPFELDMAPALISFAAPGQPSTCRARLMPSRRR
ncbi:hypothetical protein [Mesorhizobium sp. WSM4906]|uniref:hypothetical protein n=1 Tax=Mesorhizobium sp. WSM4906 TaxID=3038546 RepID=UPI00241677CF|nr:hypothetical protein [Mesorhizobium sp. WSM4906]WFP78379.1 hypothetical protein QAZ22_11510 [Mesorhizobium sp. WSM4906]